MEWEGINPKEPSSILQNMTNLKEYFYHNLAFSKCESSSIGNLKSIPHKVEPDYPKKRAIKRKISE